jgi:hypothetical protein
MSGCKILPIGNPQIMAYQNYAFPLSVLACDDEYLPWFYSNLIQLYYIADSKVPFTFFYNGASVDPLLSIPMLQNQYLKSQTVINNNIDLIDFIINSIRDGYYLKASVNEFFIPNRRAHCNHNFNHGIMVYGYDYKEKLIYCLGFNERYIFCSSKITFDDFSKAFYSTGTDSDLYLFKKNNYKYCFDLSLVTELLYDYLHSDNTSQRLKVNKNPLSNCKFGLEACKYLIEYFKLLQEGRVEYDIRPLHVIWEHKKCMLGRLKYMYDNNYLEDISYIYNEYSNLEKEALAIRNIFIKWNITNDKSIIVRIIESLESIIKREEKAAFLLLKQCSAL